MHVAWLVHALGACRVILHTAWLASKCRKRLARANRRMLPLPASVRQAILGQHRSHEHVHAFAQFVSLQVWAAVSISATVKAIVYMEIGNFTEYMGSTITDKGFGGGKKNELVYLCHGISSI